MEKQKESKADLIMRIIRKHDKEKWKLVVSHVIQERTRFLEVTQMIAIIHLN